MVMQWDLPALQKKAVQVQDTASADRITLYVHSFLLVHIYFNGTKQWLQ